MTDSPRCTADRKNGEPCGSPPMANSTTCAHHSDRFTDDEKKEWARRGALANQRKAARTDLAIAESDAAAVLPRLPARPNFRAPDGILTFLEDVAEALVNRALAPSAAAVLEKLVTAASKALEVEQVVRLTEIAEERRKALHSQGIWSDH